MTTAASDIRGPDATGWNPAGPSNRQIAAIPPPVTAAARQVVLLQHATIAIEVPGVAPADRGLPLGGVREGPVVLVAAVRAVRTLYSRPGRTQTLRRPRVPEAIRVHVLEVRHAAVRVLFVLMPLSSMSLR